MLQILVIFGIPAIIAYFAGKWLDVTYDMRPTGSIIAIVIALAVSWALTIRIYRQLTKEFKDLLKEEEKQKEKE